MGDEEPLGWALLMIAGCLAVAALGRMIGG